MRAHKRGAGAAVASLDTRSEAAPPPPVSSTTPSRLATLAEECAAMRAALEELPPDVRDVVRMRLFEELPVARVAEVLGIGESAVKHRLRRGVVEYEGRLRRILDAMVRSRHDDVDASAP